jgi:hypothetical protein
MTAAITVTWASMLAVTSLMTRRMNKITIKDRASPLSNPITTRA